LIHGLCEHECFRERVSICSVRSPSLAQSSVKPFASNPYMATLLNFAALPVPLLVVVVWVEANRAHSAEHIGFVRRSFVLFSVIPLLAAIKISRDAQRKALASPAGNRDAPA
jgi:hypothetical protein